MSHHRKTVTATGAPEAVGPYSHAVVSNGLVFCSGQVPLDAPVWAVHARDDDTVPFSQAEAYVDAATAAGGEATLVEVTGGHFEVVEPGSDAWAACVEVLDSIAD